MLALMFAPSAVVYNVITDSSNNNIELRIATRRILAVNLAVSHTYSAQHSSMQPWTMVSGVSSNTLTPL